MITRAQRQRQLSQAHRRVLCVDDDANVLEGLKDVLCRSFAVTTATSGVAALDLLRNTPDGYAVVVSDMRMPQMSGIAFLQEAGVVAPDVVRILLTGQADVNAAIRAVNDARLFRFLTKPCGSEDLMRACAAGLAQHHLQTAERLLLQDTLRGCVDALSEVLALTNPAAFGRAGRVKDVAGELARAAGLGNWWEVEVAAMLTHIGAVTLPQEITEKLYAGVPLTDQESKMASRVPLVTRQLLGRIPRLDGVLEILDARAQQADSMDDATAVGSSPVGARVLHIAVDYIEFESEGVSSDVALGALRSRGIYDTALLDTLGAVVRGDEILEVIEVEASRLEPGMTLADDARTVKGGLLIARGQRVTERMIERLANLGADAVHEPLLVITHMADGAVAE